MFSIFLAASLLPAGLQGWWEDQNVHLGPDYADGGWGGAEDQQGS